MVDKIVKVKVRTEVVFHAAHWLPGHEGKCKELHGHSWRVECTIRGPINKETGMVVDFGIIKEVLMCFDHKCINDFINMPTAENLVQHFSEKIGNMLNKQNVDTESAYHIMLRLWESEKSYAEIWNDITVKV